MKNRDRDDQHRRRREAGGSDDADGRAVAAALYGGEIGELEDNDDSDEPTLFD